MSSTGLDSLAIPADLFYNILYHVKDLTFLWTSCREVSTDFKRAVERVFITKHLRKTWLKFDGGWCYSTEHGKVSLATEFAFSHLDPSPTHSRATFADKECVDKFRPYLVQSLKGKLARGNPALTPQILVQVRREVNDTQVPDFEADWDKLEISFDWKKMYSAYFREEKEFSRRLRAFVEASKEKVLALREQVERGELDTVTSFKQVLAMMGDNHLEIRKLVRRDRIRREVWERDGEELTSFHDARALERLKQIRFMASFDDPYSDESEEEEAEEEVEDEEDEEGDQDDWEDEDEESGEGEGGANERLRWG